ncbi:MAG: DUF4194 domain-containing protein [Luteolibacter sp.]
MNTPESAPESPQEPALSAVVIPLLKGVIYQENDPPLWSRLIALDAIVRDYLRVLDLELVLDEAEGYAFLRSREMDEGASVKPAATPRLFPRRQLSFPVSLLLALLRKKLAESDASGGEARLVLSRDEITEMIRVFLPTHSNEARLTDQIETHLNKIAELGFIRKLKASSAAAPASYEVRRILKAFVDAQWLADFDARLDAYRRHLDNPDGKNSDD